MNHRREIPEILEEINRENPFRTPKNYFGDFPARLQHRIDQESRAGTPPRPRTIDFLKPALSLAAAFAAVIMLVYWPVQFINRHQEAGDLVTIEDNALIHEFINLFENMDDNTFFALLEEGKSYDIPETETLEEYLMSSYSEFDILIETLK